MESSEQIQVCKQTPFHWRVSIKYYFAININIGCLPKWPCPYPTSTTTPVSASVYEGSGPRPLWPPPPCWSYQPSVFGSEHPINPGQQFSQEKHVFLAFLCKLPPSTLGIILLTLVPSVQPLDFGHSVILLNILYLPYCVWNCLMACIW